tara:strand:+ start:83 stop:271 length:189 start_codon:yes stop_codon:yes gene_type:complete
MSKIVNEIPAFYKGHEKIVLPLCFYVDEETGLRVFDVETMLEELHLQLDKLEELDRQSKEEE